MGLGGAVDVEIAAAAAVAAATAAAAGSRYGVVLGGRFSVALWLVCAHF